MGRIPFIVIILACCTHLSAAASTRTECSFVKKVDEGKHMHRRYAHCRKLNVYGCYPLSKPSNRKPGLQPHLLQATGGPVVVVFVEA